MLPVKLAVFTKLHLTLNIASILGSRVVAPAAFTAFQRNLFNISFFLARHCISLLSQNKPLLMEIISLYTFIGQNRIVNSLISVKYTEWFLTSGLKLVVCIKKRALDRI